MSEEVIEKERAEKIATDFAKRRFEGSKIKIASAELTEVAGVPIYEVVGDSWTTASKISFIAQIAAKTGKVLGLHLFYWLQGQYNPTDF